jgi:hypothetical protein
MMTLSKTRFLVTAALGASLVLGASLLLSACGKEPSLKTAPPMWGAKAKADWSAGVSSSDSASNLSFTDTSVSASSLSGGGSEATLSSSSSKATERALPDANGPNKTPNPYAGNKKISEAPLEGVGNAEGTGGGSGTSGY